MMNPNSPTLIVSRRDTIKILGAGAVLASLGSLTKTASGQPPEPAAAPSTPQPFVLPPLGFAYDALEPHIDARTMEIHYTKHHQAYITNANKALADHPDLHALSAEAILGDLGAIPESIRTALRNNVGGHVNHSFFWRLLDPAQFEGAETTNSLVQAIGQTFGSLDAFKTQFAAAAMKQFGSGWAWLSVKNGQLTVHSTPNQDSPLSEGAKPVIGLDVWEHAYYLKHQNVRADYVAEFWNVLNWRRAGANFSTG
jgi:Fe-Mn family superoxide dismutase